MVQPSMVELLKMSTDCDVLSVCFDGVDLSKKDLVSTFPNHTVVPSSSDPLRVE